MPIEPDILQALVRTIELKDLCTAAHTWRVVMYTRVLAERLEMAPEVIQRLTNAAALHDLGKIDIPDDILQKPGALTPAEFEVMKRHTVLGWERLRDMGEEDDLMLSVVRHHHERVDGKGYPDGLMGDDIHLAARMFAVVDSFDAMTSVRPYHAAFGKEAATAALHTLHDEADTHFCPAAVQLMQNAFDSGDLDWILTNFNGRASLPVYAGPHEAERLAAELRERRL